jgi:hypothetical protein
LDTIKATVLTDWPEFARLGVDGLGPEIRAAVDDKGGTGFEIVDHEVTSTGKFKINGQPVEVEGPDLVFITATAVRPAA